MTPKNSGYSTGGANPLFAKAHTSSAQAAAKRQKETALENNLRSKATQCGISVPQEKVHDLAIALKKQELGGADFRDARASLVLFFQRQLGALPNFFEMIKAEITSSLGNDEAEAKSTATLKLRIGNEVEHRVAEGVGPVDAINKALREALQPHYKQVEEFALRDYKVKTVMGGKGTESRVCVLITFGKKHAHTPYTVQGADANLEKASWLALRDAYAYCLLLCLRNDS